MEKITWIDNRSSLLIGKRTYKSGDIIPAGVIPGKNLDRLIREKKIRIGEPKKDATKKSSTVFGAPVTAQVTGEPVKLFEPGLDRDDKPEDTIFGMARSKFLDLSKDEKKRVKAKFKNPVVPE